MVLEISSYINVIITSFLFLSAGNGTVTVIQIGEGMGVMKSHIEILSETFTIYNFCIEFWKYSEHGEQETYGQLIVPDILLDKHLKTCTVL